ncbi:hypothetical protein [Legionella fairfieldensis]|uniref:hypothetical protein n=1 Tax=Legionella fairfieldensis TaxID=45064 RepID=UPI00048A7AA4|nr:hypothetical protein [Legionella fairfieldensis]
MRFFKFLSTSEEDTAIKILYRIAEIDGHKEASIFDINEASIALSAVLKTNLHKVYQRLDEYPKEKFIGTIANRLYEKAKSYPAIQPELNNAGKIITNYETGFNYIYEEHYYQLAHLNNDIIDWRKDIVTTHLVLPPALFHSKEELTNALATLSKPFDRALFRLASQSEYMKNLPRELRKQIAGYVDPTAFPQREDKKKRLQKEAVIEQERVKHRANNKLRQNGIFTAILFPIFIGAIVAICFMPFLSLPLLIIPVCVLLIVAVTIALKFLRSEKFKIEKNLQENLNNITEELNNKIELINTTECTAHSNNNHTHPVHSHRNNYKQYALQQTTTEEGFMEYLAVDHFKM